VVKVIVKNLYCFTCRRKKSGGEWALDGRKKVLIRSGDTPTVIFGPGVTAQMHSMDETGPIENLVTAAKVIALTILQCCNPDRLRKPEDHPA
jgi:acetylornithine deacetylase